MKADPRYLRYEPETRAAFAAVPHGTVAKDSHGLGLDGCEPLIVILDSLIRYAKAYERRMGQPLADDGVLADCWLDCAKGVRGLLDGDGALAMEANRSTDSKDNGACETMFWSALRLAGYQEFDGTPIESASAAGGGA